MATEPTHKAHADPLEDRVMSIVLADIRSGGPIYQAILKRLNKAIHSAELRRPKAPSTQPKFPLTPLCKGGEREGDKDHRLEACATRGERI
jgi:hypothetical protein